MKLNINQVISDIYEINKQRLKIGNRMVFGTFQKPLTRYSVKAVRFFGHCIYLRNIS